MVSFALHSYKIANGLTGDPHSEIDSSLFKACVQEAITHKRVCNMATQGGSWEAEEPPFPSYRPASCISVLLLFFWCRIEEETPEKTEVKERASVTVRVCAHLVVCVCVCVWF